MYFELVELEEEMVMREEGHIQDTHEFVEEGGPLVQELKIVQRDILREHDFKIAQTHAFIQRNKILARKLDKVEEKIDKKGCKKKRKFPRAKWPVEGDGMGDGMDWDWELYPGDY